MTICSMLPEHTADHTKLAVIVHAREGSTRAPSKLTRYLMDRTVLEWSLSSLRPVCRDLAIQLYVGLDLDDRKLLEATVRAGVTVFKRDKRSVTGETAQDVFHAEYVQKMEAKGIKYLVTVNPCFPFLPAHITWSFLNDMLRQPMKRVIGVRTAPGIFWDKNRQPIFDVSEGLNTKTAPVVYEPAHIYYAWPTACLGKPEQNEYDEFWTVPKEFGTILDIDDEVDFQTAQLVARGLHCMGLQIWHSDLSTTRTDSKAVVFGSSAPAPHSMT